jgi:hypothetical protein
MVYDARPPYEVLCTALIDFESMQRLRRFARYWDLVANSGNFVETAPRIWSEASPFRSFLAFSDWLYARTRRTHAIALPRLAELVFEYLTTERGLRPDDVARALARDYCASGRRDLPVFLRRRVGHGGRTTSPNAVVAPGAALPQGALASPSPVVPLDALPPPRQARHWWRSRARGLPEDR